MLGIRPRIWVILGVQLVLLAGLVARLGGDAAGTDGAPSRSDRGTAAARTDRGAGGPAAAAPTPATHAGAGRSGAAARTQADPAIRAIKADGGATGRRVARRDADAVRARPTGGRGASAEPSLERELERIARSLDLPILPGAAATAPAASGADDGGAVDDAARTRAAADAALAEFLLRAELGARFSNQSQLVPWGYPVNRLRAEMATRVAALGPRERSELMALAADQLPIQELPLMSGPESGNVYTGRDGSSRPVGVVVYEPDRGR